MSRISHNDVLCGSLGFASTTYDLGERRHLIERLQLRHGYDVT